MSFVKMFVPIGLICFALGCGSGIGLGIKTGPEYLTRAKPWLAEVSRTIPELKALAEDPKTEAGFMEDDRHDPPVHSIIISNGTTAAIFTMQGQLTGFHSSPAESKIDDQIWYRREPAKPLTEAQLDSFKANARELIEKLYPNHDVRLKDVIDMAADVSEDFPDAEPIPTISLYHDIYWKDYPVLPAHLTVDFNRRSGALEDLSFSAPDLSGLELLDRAVISEVAAIEKARAHWRGRKVDIGDAKPNAKLIVGCALETGKGKRPRVNTKRCSLAYAIGFKNPEEYARVLWIDSRDGTVLRDNSDEEWFEE